MRARVSVPCPSKPESAGLSSESINNNRGSQKAASPIRPTAPYSATFASSNGSFSAQANKLAQSTADVLEKEALVMEERLAKLKLAMMEEKLKLKQIAENKRPDGAIWKAARPISTKNYTEQVMEKVRQKEAQEIKQIRSTSTKPPSASGSVATDPSQQPTASAKKVDIMVISRPEPSPIASIAPTPKRPTSTYAPPVVTARPPSAKSKPQPTIASSVSQPFSSTIVPAPSSLLAGDVDERKEHEWFLAARAEFLKGPSSNSASLPPTDNVSNTTSSNSNNSSASVASNGWWDGDFDEEANSKAFATARAEFLASVPTPAPSSDLKRGPLPTISENSINTPLNNSGSNGLQWWEGAFDEKANATEFAQARSAFLSNPTENNNTNSSTNNTNNTIDWSFEASQRPSTSFAFLLDRDITTPAGPKPLALSSSEEGTMTARNRGSDSIKMVCYQCFKKFEHSAACFADESVTIAISALPQQQAQPAFCSQKCVETYTNELAEKERARALRTQSLLEANQSAAAATAAPITASPPTEPSDNSEAIAASQPIVVVNTAPVVVLPDDDDE